MYRILGVVFALVLIGALYGAPASATPDTRVYAPVVSGAPRLALPQTALIYSCQCGAVDASVLPNGDVLLTFQDHSRGGATIVGIDDGVTFRELPNQPVLQRSIEPEPSFDFPGLKQGIGSSVYAFGAIVTYAPNRTEPNGRYNIWRFPSPLPTK